MANGLTILGVHGLGDHRNSDWKEKWEETIRASFPGQDKIALNFKFITYDPIFEKEQISAWDTAQAVWKLTTSAVTSSFRREKGLISKISDRVRWTAGYIVAWVEEDSFKEATRALVLDALKEYQPDILLGHSLGSLVTFNALTHRQALDPDVQAVMSKMRYITLGSQIANPFVVRNLTPGRVIVPAVKYWHHLYNREDDVFTAPIRILDQDNFSQVDTPFDNEGWADHAAESYLGHRGTINNVWRPIAEEALAPANEKAFATMAMPRVIKRPANDPRRYKALLVGINNYPDPAMRLEGCVNDVFRMSEVLQECGFPPTSIRVCLDERATARGILERLEWLLDDPRPEDELVFFYSGHGAQIPEYGEDNEPDRKTESLVPHDFDWSPEHAITDDRIYSLYSQLPFNTRLAMIFDCCHSGGIQRAGQPRPKGLSPPDDIRHREIEWRPEIGMWVQRGFKPLNKDFTGQKTGKAAVRDAETNDMFFGSNGAVSRLGRASPLRGMSEELYAKVKATTGTSAFGPYLPLIIEACKENEFSYEYKHGVTSFGAFTFALTKVLRHVKNTTFADLVVETRRQLHDVLKYDQTPQILGPRKIVDAKVPWVDAMAAPKKPKQQPRRKPKSKRTTVRAKRPKKAKSR